ncbi:hypothetical protein [Paramagnetospirillum magnetotacticum]|uniref:hypothetical protein n=1 Tax=Paramagnetospirillum magnetotacticum TaxID=188 RepID=UPI00126999F7|nr:hypothetical protein [Paramagnetospirillum magnetotacticum]
MAKPKKRNAAYWRGRLEREKPTFYADLIAGKHTSVRAACAAAGLIHLPNRLDALKREWRKADAVERDEFLAFAGITVAAPLSPSRAIGAPSSSTSPPPTPPAAPTAPSVTPKPPIAPSPIAAPRPGAPIAGTDRKLTASGKARLQTVMKRMGHGEPGHWKPGPLMLELGFKPLNASLGNAFARGTRVKATLIAALEGWLALHE